MAHMFHEPTTNLNTMRTCLTCERTSFEAICCRFAEKGRTLHSHPSICTSAMSHSRLFAFDQMVPSGVYIRTDRGWALARDHSEHLAAAEPALDVDDEANNVMINDIDDADHHPVSGSSWSSAPDHLFVAIGSKGTTECRSYRTAGEMIQLLRLPHSILIQQRYIYTLQLLQCVIPRVFTPQGQFVSGSTQLEIFKTLERACDLIDVLSGSFIRELTKTIQLVDKCTAACLDGNARLRRQFVLSFKHRLQLAHNGDAICPCCFSHACICTTKVFENQLVGTPVTLEALPEEALKVRQQSMTD